MKKNLFLIVFAVFSFAFAAQAQSCCSSKAKSKASCNKTSKATTAVNSTTTEARALLVSAKLNHYETAKFTVYGNCGMCKKTIEGALKDVKGIRVAEWNQDTGQMTVTFNPHVLKLSDIKQKIADVGYDTDTHRAKEEVYNSLPGCCQYERPTN